MQFNEMLKEFVRDCNRILATWNDLVAVLFIPEMEMSDERILMPSVLISRLETKLA